MSGGPDPLYVEARIALLDAADALSEQLDAVVLVGAQAIYLHTGDADFATAEYTTDADLCVAPPDLSDTPLLAELSWEPAGSFSGSIPGRGSVRMGSLLTSWFPRCWPVSAPAGLASALTERKQPGEPRVWRERSLTGRPRISALLIPATNDRLRCWSPGPPRSLVAKVAQKIADRAGTGDRHNERTHSISSVSCSRPPATLAACLARLGDHELSSAVTPTL